MLYYFSFFKKKFMKSVSNILNSKIFFLHLKLIFFHLKMNFIDKFSATQSKKKIRKLSDCQVIGEHNTNGNLSSRHDQTTIILFGGGSLLLVKSDELTQSAITVCEVALRGSWKWELCKASTNSLASVSVFQEVKLNKDFLNFLKAKFMWRMIVG